MLLLFVLSFTACAKEQAYLDAPVSGETIAIDIKTLKEAEPVFYSFRHKDKRIIFFAVKIKEEVQSYFDVCARCSADRLGYRVEGAHVTCKKCGIKYSIESLKTGIGSCYPIALKGKVEGDKYIIDKSAVIEGEKFF